MKALRKTGTLRLVAVPTPDRKPAAWLNSHNGDVRAPGRGRPALARNRLRKSASIALVQIKLTGSFERPTDWMVMHRSQLGRQRRELLVSLDSGLHRQSDELQTSLRLASALPSVFGSLSFGWVFLLRMRL